MKSKFFIGIDLGGTNLKIALVDSKFRIRSKKILNTQRFTKKEQLINAAVRAISELISSSGLRKNNIIGVGVGLPGPVDTSRGLVHYFPNIPGWKEVRLEVILRRKLGLPVFLDNDANLMCLAEYKVGSAKGAKNAVCITLGTGVGGGLIIEGKLFRGSTFAAGEVGHIPINVDGPACGCGGRGCLERYVGNKVILKEARKEFGTDMTLEKLSLLAKKANNKAIRIWKTMGENLGVMLTGVINVINPDIIVIGGGVSAAGSTLFDSVRDTVKKRAMYIQARHVKIVRAKLGNDAGMIGAALLVKEELSR